MLRIVKDPGIYTITNTTNGKQYVGSSINPTHRKSDHFGALRKGKHHSRKLQSAWNKYGEGAFIFEVIELCETGHLITREQVYLDTLRPFYNISPTADSPRGIKRSAAYRAKLSAALMGHVNSPEARAKMSASQKGKKRTEEWKAKMSEIMKKRTFSPEHRRRLSIATTRYRTGKKQSEETKRRRGIALTGNKNSLGKNLGNPGGTRQKGSKRSPETILKLTEAQRKRRKAEREAGIIT